MSDQVAMRGWVKFVVFLVSGVAVAALLSAGIAVALTLAWNTVARHSKLAPIPFLYAWMPLFVLTLASTKINIEG
jgi:hypothetical protein